MRVFGCEWRHAGYFILKNPLSTAVIVPVDSHGRPIDSAFAESRSGDAWSVMTGPNPQF